MHDRCSTAHIKVMPKIQVTFEVENDTFRPARTTEWDVVPVVPRIGDQIILCERSGQPGYRCDRWVTVVVTAVLWQAPTDVLITVKEAS